MGHMSDPGHMPPMDKSVKDKSCRIADRSRVASGMENAMSAGVGSCWCKVIEGSRPGKMDRSTMNAGGAIHTQESMAVRGVSAEENY